MSSLRLPNKREVQYFREKRLLIHLHDQLIEQIEEHHADDWQLHFQLANLLAFSRDSFYSDRKIDQLKSEHHYQQSLTLLRQLHEQNYIVFQNQMNVHFPSISTPFSPLHHSHYTLDECTVYKEDDEEKMPSISPQLISMSQSNHYSFNLNEKEKKKRKKKRKHNNTKSITDNLSISIDPQHNMHHKTRRQRASLREHDNGSMNDNKTKHNIDNKRISTPLVYKIKKRKLVIMVRNDNDQVSKKIKCKYSSAMSKDEIEREKETTQNKGSHRSKRRWRIDRYMAAIHKLNNPIKSSKRPSIIMMFTPNSPQNGGTSSGNQSPITLSQSVSAQHNTEYVVPHHIIKGYTECFFGYGKYLVLNHRVKEGVHNLLECASWYDDSFVDPSCLTSLVLPPQFLFQDSVKKRHCINFRTLTKYISRTLGDEQKHLDKQFKDINMSKYIAEYEHYFELYQDEIQEHLTIAIVNDSSHEHEDSDSATTSSHEFTLGAPALKLECLELSNKSNNTDHSVSDASLSPNPYLYDSPMLSPLLSPDVSNDVSNNVHNGYEHIQQKQRELLNYRVYPQHVQDLVAHYEDVCGYYHRLGLLLIDFLRYSDAKREFSRALAIFRKLKIKSPLYEEIVSEIRNVQHQSARSPSGRERAQFLAARHQTPSSRSNARPLSPSFEFSFSDQFSAMHQNTDKIAVR